MQCTLQAQVECYFILRSHHFFLMLLKKQVGETVPFQPKLDREIIYLKYMSPKGAKMLSDHAERRQHSFKISRSVNCIFDMDHLQSGYARSCNALPSKGQESRPLYLQTTGCGQLSFYDKWFIQFYLVNSGQPLPPGATLSVKSKRHLKSTL